MRISENESMCDAVVVKRDSGEITISDKEYMPLKTQYACDSTKSFKLTVFKVDGDDTKDIECTISYNPHEACHSRQMKRVLKKFRKFVKSSEKWYSENGPVSRPYPQSYSERRNKRDYVDDAFSTREKFFNELMDYMRYHPQIISTFIELDGYKPYSFVYGSSILYY